MDATNTAVVAVRPQPRILHGELAPADFDSVKRWIAENEKVLLGYWNGDLSTVEFALGLTRI
jgi:hypothetical protein